MFLLELYSVNNSTCSKIKSQIIKLDLKDAAIINSTNDFYYLFTKNMIVLLKKTDLTIMKSFDISYSNLGILKISDKTMLLFLNKNDKLFANIYNVSSNGIRIDNIEKKEIINGKVNNIFKSNNYILFMKEYDRKNKNYECSLFCITKKN